MIDTSENNVLSLLPSNFPCGILWMLFIFIYWINIIVIYSIFLHATDKWGSQPFANASNKPLHFDRWAISLSSQLWTRIPLGLNSCKFSTSISYTSRLPTFSMLVICSYIKWCTSNHLESSSESSSIYVSNVLCISLPFLKNSYKFYEILKFWANLDKFLKVFFVWNSERFYLQGRHIVCSIPNQ